MTLTKNNRGVIRLGDSTTHGGKVVKVGTQDADNNIPIARVGDMTVCPKCKGSYPIIEGEPTFTIDGIAVALDGHKTACGASLITSVK